MRYWDSKKFENGLKQELKEVIVPMTIRKFSKSTRKDQDGGEVKRGK